MFMPKKIICSNAGFSLIEILTVSSIFVLLTVGMSLYTNDSSVNDFMYKTAVETEARRIQACLTIFNNIRLQAHYGCVAFDLTPEDPPLGHTDPGTYVQSYQVVDLIPGSQMVMPKYGISQGVEVKTEALVPGPGWVQFKQMFFNSNDPSETNNGLHLVGMAGEDYTNITEKISIRVHHIRDSSYQYTRYVYFFPQSGKVIISTDGSVVHTI